MSPKLPISRGLTEEPDGVVETGKDEVLVGPWLTTDSSQRECSVSGVVDVADCDYQLSKMADSGLGRARAPRELSGFDASTRGRHSLGLAS